MTKPAFHDAFPSDGLVAEHKPYILKETKRYSRLHKMPFRHLIWDAVRAAPADRRNGCQDIPDMHTHF
jgi:hypothetical protein